MNYLTLLVLWLLAIGGSSSDQRPLGNSPLLRPPSSAETLIREYLNDKADMIDRGIPVRFPKWSPSDGDAIRNLDIGAPYPEFLMAEGKLYKFATSGDLVKSAGHPRFIYPLYEAERHAISIVLEPHGPGSIPQVKRVHDMFETETVTKIRKLFPESGIARFFWFGSGAFYVILDGSNPIYLSGQCPTYDFSKSEDPFLRDEELGFILWHYQDVLPHLIDRASRRTKYVDPTSRYIVARTGATFFEDHVEFVGETRNHAGDTYEVWLRWKVDFPEIKGAHLILTVKITAEGKLIEGIAIPDCINEPWKCHVEVDIDSAKTIARSAGFDPPIFRDSTALKYGGDRFDGFVWEVTSRASEHGVRWITINAYDGTIVDTGQSKAQRLAN